MLVPLVKERQEAHVKLYFRGLVPQRIEVGHNFRNVGLHPQLPKLLDIRLHKVEEVLKYGNMWEHGAKSVGKCFLEVEVNLFGIHPVLGDVFEDLKRCSIICYAREKMINEK